jgi:HlyD family type I secretion membrane fusion protein
MSIQAAPQHAPPPAILAADSVTPRPSSSISGVVFFGVIVVLSIFVGLGAWAAIAPLARAVAAPAILSVKGERKQIQHLEGGIVESLHVEEGQKVENDQLLVRLSPLQAGATVSRFRNQMDQAVARNARLNAELRGDDAVTFSGELLDQAMNTPAVLDIIEAEQRQFRARRESFNGNIDILKQRIEQFHEQISGFKIQRKSRLEQITLFSEELVGLRELYEKGYYPRSQVLAIERALAQLKGNVGSDDAEIARARSGIGEAESQIINSEQRFREQITAELRDTQAEISDLRERVIVANDILHRIEIRAPLSGIVQNLLVHTVGGVVRPGEALMEITPQGEELMVDARVSPTDIDSIAIGQKAEVLFSALNLRSTPIILGTVLTISGDIIADKATGQAYFLARVEVPKEEREKLGDVKLSAGMPAEVLIQAGERTALEYFMKPIMDQFSRGLNEE